MKMKKIYGHFLTAALLCGMFPHVSVATVFEGATTGVKEEFLASDADAKKEPLPDTVVQDSSESEKNIGQSSAIADQQRVLEKHADQKDSESIIALKKLTDALLCVTSDSLESANNDPTVALLKIDVYEGANLAILMKNSFDYLLKGSDASQKKLTDSINVNSTLKSKIEQLRDAFAELSKYDRCDFDNEQYNNAYSRALSCFVELKNAIESDSSFSKKDYFVDFITLAEKFTNLTFVRYNTEKMLSKIRGSLEGIQGVMGSTSTSLSVNIPLPMQGASANLDVFTSGNAYGSTGLSFYTITKSKGVKAGITFNILPAKISGKLGIEKAALDIFYSLEAYMDFLNSSSSSTFNKFQASDMKKSAADRKDMQQKEKDALANSGMLGKYFGLFKALPYGVSFQWVNITRAESTDKASELSAFVEVAANVDASTLSSLGITLKASKGTKKYMKDAPILSLINDDFSIVDGIDIEDLTRIIGKKFDLSENISDSNLLLGTLNSYLSALEGLATAESSKIKDEFEKKKHSCEKLLLPKKMIGSYGRAGVLKSSVLTATILRKKLPSNREQILRFKKIHEALVKLALLTEFSKNQSGVRKFFGYGTKASTETAAKASVNNLQASFSVKVPSLANASAVVTRKTIEGSPLLQENGKYITLKVSLPLGSAGIVGMGVLREKFKSIFAKSGLPVQLSDFTSVAKSFGASAVGTVGSKILTAVGSPIGVSAYGSSDFTFVWLYVAPPKDFSSIVPLPGMVVIKNYDGKWVLDFVAVATMLNAGVDMSKLPISVPLSLKASISSGKLAKRTGPSTFHDIISKFNALSLGKADSQSEESTAINSLLSGQSGQLLKSFTKVSQKNSNVLFELQDLYNGIMKKLKNDSSGAQKCTKLFENFIAECKKLAAAQKKKDSAEDDASAENEVQSLTIKPPEEPVNIVDQYKKAFDSFKEILDMQHTYIFKPHYEESFKKSNL
jgi:hypothetical protein